MKPLPDGQTRPLDSPSRTRQNRQTKANLLAEIARLQAERGELFDENIALYENREKLHTRLRTAASENTKLAQTIIECQAAVMQLNKMVCNLSGQLGIPPVLCYPEDLDSLPDNIEELGFIHHQAHRN